MHLIAHRLPRTGTVKSTSGDGIMLEGYRSIKLGEGEGFINAVVSAFIFLAHTKTNNQKKIFNNNLSPWH